MDILGGKCFTCDKHVTLGYARIDSLIVAQVIECKLGRIGNAGCEEGMEKRKKRSEPIHGIKDATVEDDFFA